MPACTPAVDEQPKEDGEDFEDLSCVLEHLGLSEYKSTFDNEKIDIESFVRDNRRYCFTPLYPQRHQCYFSHPIFVAASSLWSLCPTFQLLCTIEDLKEMGIPLGPRKKIAKFVKERVNKQVGASLGYLCLSRTWPWLLRARVDLLCPGCPSGSAGGESRG